MSTQYQNPALPSRTGPVVTIVLGALAMFLGPLIGLLVSVSGVVSKIDVEEMASGTQTISDGSSVSLHAGDWMVIPENGISSRGYQCEVTGMGRIDTRSMEGIVLFTAPRDGRYTIDCTTSGNLWVAPAADIGSLVDAAPGFAGAFAGGMLVGFLGLVALILGIVWLVRVNRRRREMQFGAWGGGYGGGGGYGPGGGYGYGGGYPGSYPPPGTTAPGGNAPWTGPAGSQPWSGQPVPGQPNPNQPAPGPTPWRPTEPPRYGERIEPEEPRPSE